MKIRINRFGNRKLFADCDTYEEAFKVAAQDIKENGTRFEFWEMQGNCKRFLRLLDAQGVKEEKEAMKGGRKA